MKKKFPPEKVTSLHPVDNRLLLLHSPELHHHHHSADRCHLRLSDFWTFQMAVGQNFGPVELLQNGLDVSLGQIELVLVASDLIVLL